MFGNRRLPFKTMGPWGSIWKGSNGLSSSKTFGNSKVMFFSLPIATSCALWWIYFIELYYLYHLKFIRLSYCKPALAISMKCMKPSFQQSLCWDVPVLVFLNSKLPMMDDFTQSTETNIFLDKSQKPFLLAELFFGSLICCRSKNARAISRARTCRNAGVEYAQWVLCGIPNGWTLLVDLELHVGESSKGKSLPIFNRRPVNFTKGGMQKPGTAWTNKIVLENEIMGNQRSIVP